MSMPRNMSPISRLGLLWTLASQDEITLKSKVWLSLFESVYFIWKYKEHIKRAPFISEGKRIGGMGSKIGKLLRVHTIIKIRVTLVLN